jgi:hypothetical protein
MGIIVICATKAGSAPVKEIVYKTTLHQPATIRC